MNKKINIVIIALSALAVTFNVASPRSVDGYEVVEDTREFAMTNRFANLTFVQRGSQYFIRINDSGYECPLHIFFQKNNLPINDIVGHLYDAMPDLNGKLPM